MFVIRTRDGDVAAQTDCLRRERGMTDRDRLIIIHREIVAAGVGLGPACGNDAPAVCEMIFCITGQRK